VITTRKSFTFRVHVSVSAGRATPIITVFTASRGMFSRASPVVFVNEDDRNGVVSIASKGQDLYLLAWKTLQKWTISQDNQKVCFSFSNELGLIGSFRRSTIL
jgi:nuclear pore complex protein Nup133